MDIIYNIILIFIFLLSFAEVLFLKRKKKFFFYGIVFVLIFISGFRYEVGSDYSSYKNAFFIIQNTNKPGVEWGYHYLNKIFASFQNGFIGVFFTIAFFAILSKAIAIFKYSHYPILVLLLYYVIYYFNGDSGQIRQNLAMGICLYATQYIFEKRFFKFLFAIILATSFHNTAIIFIFSYFIGNIKKISKNALFLSFLIVMGLSFTDVKYIFKPIIEYFSVFDLDKKYMLYVDSKKYGQRYDFTYGDVTRVIFFFLFTININKMIKENKNIQLFFLLYMVSIFLYFLFRSNVIFAVRLGLYYKIFEILMIPELIYLYRKNIRVKLTYTSIALVYVILLYLRLWKLGSGNFLNYKNYIFME
ncbi:MAG: EpsG family protein [Flavobacteriales bacterium AspAUS03]